MSTPWILRHKQKQINLGPKNRKKIVLCTKRSIIIKYNKKSQFSVYNVKIIVNILCLEELKFAEGVNNMRYQHNFLPVAPLQCRVMPQPCPKG